MSDILIDNKDFYKFELKFLNFFSKQKPCFCVVKSTQVSGDGVSFI